MHLRTLAPLHMDGMSQSLRGDPAALWKVSTKGLGFRCSNTKCMYRSLWHVFARGRACECGMCRGAADCGFCQCCK